MKRLAEMYLPFFMVFISIIFCLYCHLTSFIIEENILKELIQYLITMSSIFLSFDGVMLGLLYSLIDKVKNKSISAKMYQDIYRYTFQSILVNFISILLVVISSFVSITDEAVFTYIIICFTTAVVFYNFRVIYILLSMVKINVPQPFYRK